jgi:Na+-transporting methylmalonyl-CoA/oxaloacetate decarboxylase gamma subunit
MNPFQLFFMMLGFKYGVQYKNNPFKALLAVLMLVIIVFLSLWLLIMILAGIGHIIGPDTNSTTQISSEQTSSPDPQQTNQNYTSQAIQDPNQNFVQVDTAQMAKMAKAILADTTKQIQTSNEVVSNTNNNTNTTIVDDDEKSIIEKYLKGQDNRNFEEFAQYYAPNIRRNWEMYNPTLSQIQGAIYHLWSVTSSSSQTINNIETVNDSTVKADVTNTYVTRKKNLTKQIEYDIYFVFDDNNKIVETYGFQK